MDSESRFAPATVRILTVLPLFLGLVACLDNFPVPVGDPEKSRIDPYISGIWVQEDESTFYVFEPYDKRTWILVTADLSETFENCEVAEESEENSDSNLEVEELSFYERFIADIVKYGTNCYEIEQEEGAVKVWRTKLGGEWFMTWEPLGFINAESGFEPDAWMVWGIDTSGPNQLQLRMMSDEHEGWDALDDIDDEDIRSRDVEKIIRKHARDDDFFAEDAVLHLDRVLPEHYELVEDFFDEGMME
jgi:hypothetical protein